MFTKRMRMAFALLWIGAAPIVHAAETATYTYDALGRLTDTQNSGGVANGAVVTYRYDAAGNRTSHSSTHPTGSQAVSVNPDRGVATVNAVGATLVINVGSPTASGTITLTEGGVFLGSAAVINGQATLILEDYPLGLHTITATYSGDSAHAPASSTYQIRVVNLAWLPAVLNLLLE